jgi:hypothetical protein
MWKKAHSLFSIERRMTLAGLLLKNRTVRSGDFSHISWLGKERSAMKQSNGSERQIAPKASDAWLRDCVGRRVSLSIRTGTSVDIRRRQTRNEMKNKILIMGLPGAGKTTLARALAPLIGAVIFNADEVRANLNRDLGFSPEDRIEHARRMGWLCDRVVAAGVPAIADFICPLPAARAAFGDAFCIWVDRIEAGRFEDTNRLFVVPERWDVRIEAQGAPAFWADRVATMLKRA